MRVRTFPGGGFAENGYLVECVETGAAAIVDPGATAPAIVAAARTSGADVQALLLTHAHLDHIEGVHVIRDAFPSLPIWLHRADLGMYRALPQQAAAFGMDIGAQPEPDHWLEHGQALSLGDATLEVRFAPGHAPGHVVFYAPDAKLALVGDVVFQGSIGRTDLPGGDLYTLMRSIREQILTLPDETVLHPGHGPATTVGAERTGNPFLIPHFGGELV